MGAGNINNVPVNSITNTYSIGGTVAGMTGSGLVLQDNGGNNLTSNANGSFTFTAPIPSGASYAVTILTQPSAPAQTCTVVGASGNVTAAAIANVVINCPGGAALYTVGGTVTGLAGSNLVLQDNGGNNLAIAANGAFTFTQAIAAGASYSVTVSTQPSSPSQFCFVGGGSGTANATVSSVVVSCYPEGLFISCGASGASGPTGAQCTSAYAGTQLSGQVTVTGSGNPAVDGALHGHLRSSPAAGAQGGTSQNTGGLGALEKGSFSLSSGTVLQILRPGRCRELGCQSVRRWRRGPVMSSGRSAADHRWRRWRRRQWAAAPTTRGKRRPARAPRREQAEPQDVELGRWRRRLQRKPKAPMTPLRQRRPGLHQRRRGRWRGELALRGSSAGGFGGGGGAGFFGGWLRRRCRRRLRGRQWRQPQRSRQWRHLVQQRNEREPHQRWRFGGQRFNRHRAPVVSKKRTTSRELRRRRWAHRARPPAKTLQSSDGKLLDRRGQASAKSSRGRRRSRRHRAIARGGRRRSRRRFAAGARR